MHQTLLRVCIAIRKEPDMWFYEKEKVQIEKQGENKTKLNLKNNRLFREKIRAILLFNQEIQRFFYIIFT